MGKRTLPFGYKMEEGVIVPHEGEAPLVRWVFNQYLEGVSIPAIAQQLVLSPIPYRSDAAWNKNMVCRILDNAKYTGTESHPAIIETEMFAKTKSRRSQKRSGSLNPILREVRNSLCCAACHHLLQRDTHRSQWDMVWHCPHCGMSTIPLEDGELLQRIVNAVNRLLVTPLPPQAAAIPHSLEAEKFSREIDRELADPLTDAAHLLELMEKRAQAEYTVCLTVPLSWERRRMEAAISQRRPTPRLDNDLFHTVVEKTLLNEAGTVTLLLADHTLF